MKIQNIADITNEETGKTFREENHEKKHNIPLGALVEVDFDDSYCESPKRGLRLFVVSHDRDCDGTPLYSLSFDKDWKPFSSKIIPKIAFMMAKDSGYNEKSLIVIKK